MISLLLVGVLAAVLAPNPSPSPDPSLSLKPSLSLGGSVTKPSGATRAVVDKVQARYDSTRTLQASFEQEVRVESIGSSMRSVGKVFFLKPGKMRWDYAGAEPQTIVGDGTHLWIDQPKDNQVLRAPLKAAFDSKTPVSFLLGVGRLSDDFRPQLIEPASDGSLRLRLDSKEVPADGEGDGLGSLVLEVDPVTYDIRAAKVTDQLGNTTILRLTEFSRNQQLDEALFRFVPREGADVIEAPGR